MRVACLAMYDMPHLHGANDALWETVARRLVAAGFSDVPMRLERGRPLREVWHDPGLLLTQTCGYPLVTELSKVVRPVAAPIYALPGCEGATHGSAIVVPAASPARTLADLAGARVAINGHDSNTGMNLLRAMVAPLAGGRPFFGEVVVTGAHLRSLAAVARGEADVAAIDVVTLGLERRGRPDRTEDVRIIAHTAPSPTLPFVTRIDASDAEVEALRGALASAIAAPECADAVAALALTGVVPVTLADYAVVARYEADAVGAGYPELA